MCQPGARCLWRADRFLRRIQAVVLVPLRCLFRRPWLCAQRVRADAVRGQPCGVNQRISQTAFHHRGAAGPAIVFILRAYGSRRDLGEQCETPDLILLGEIRGCPFLDEREVQLFPRVSRRPVSFCVLDLCDDHCTCVHDQSAWPVSCDEGAIDHRLVAAAKVNPFWSASVHHVSYNGPGAMKLLRINPQRSSTGRVT